MKHKLLLLLGCLFAVISIQAEEEKTISVTFSDFTSGSQYAENERHDLGEGLVIYTTDCHFTTELRIYSSSTYNGYVISDPLPGKITKMTFNMGYSKEETLNIYGRINNNDWELIKGIKTNSVSYNDYKLDIPANKVYTQFKLDVAGDNQIRIKCMSITYVIDSHISPIDKPTLSATCSFIESMNVEITNNTDGATIYYTTDGSKPSANNGTVYSEPFTITKTTTVKAIAVKEGVESDIAEAIYTKIEDYYQVSFSVNGAIDAENDILIPYGESLVESSLPAVGHPENIKMKGWAREDNSTEIVTFPITNIKEDLILYAVFELVGCFELVTDISALTEGDRVVIACPEYSKVISTADMIINGASCAVSTIVEFKDNALLPTDDSRVFVLHKNSDGYFMFENSGEFLVCPEDDNRLSMQKTPQEKMHMWAVTITDGTAIIKNKKYSREIKYNLSAPRFACYVSGQKPVSIYKEITPTTVSTTYTPLQISAAGYSTMYLDKDVTIPTTVEAYLATEVGNGYIVMTQYRGVLPRETGIILRGHEGKYAFMHSTTTTVVESLLKGTLSNEYVSGGGYVLSIQNGEIGFYKAQEKENGTFLNNANKAYLPASVVPASLQSNGLRFKIDDTANIEYQDTILNYDCQSTIIYDLMGRRVQHMNVAGVYIVNGKKISVK